MSSSVESPGNSPPKLGSGVAPVATLLASGINVAIATDGPASNNDFDMLEEMRTAALLAKGSTGDPRVIDAHRALRMATLNGAQALGLADAVGSVEPGKWADLCCIDLGSAHTQPVYDPAAARVFLDRYAEKYAPLDKPLLVGVLPLYGVKHARFLHNEVPGITIAPEFFARLEAAGQDSPHEGVCIALELIAQMRDWAGGIYLMPAFSRYDLAAEIVEQIHTT